MKHSVTQPTLNIFLAIVLAIAFSATSVSAQDTQEGVDKVNQAKETFNQAIESVQKGDTLTAITMYKGAIQLDDKLADAYLNLGSIYFAQENYKDAAENFKKYTEINATDPLGFTNLGKVYTVQKKDIEAQAAFESALAIDANYSEAQKELGKLFFSANKMDECIATLEKYTTREPSDYYAFYLLGQAYSKKGNDTKAIDSYKKAIAAKPDHADSMQKIAAIYSKRENFTEAINYYQQAMKLKPKDYKNAYNLAIAVQSQDPENYDKIIAQWEDFLKLAKKIPQASDKVSSTEQLLKDLRAAKAEAGQ